jgi:hypothetical protein
MTNPTANQLCISFAQSVTSMNGATTHHDTHIAKVTLDAVPAPTTPPPFVPLNCTQGAATNTEVASWFTAGGTILSAQASLVRLGQTSCHPLTGCVATTRDGQLPRFAKPESLVVGTNGLAVRMLDWGLDQLVDRNLTAGTFDETGHDSDGVPWTLQGSTHLGRCIETMATGTYWHAWFWQSVALSEADRTSF